MNILSLDVATKTGYAVSINNRLQKFSTIVLRHARTESHGVLFLRFAKWLNEIVVEYSIDFVIYERFFRRGGAATELAIGCASHIGSICTSRGIEYTTIPPSTLKKYITGYGRASKEDVKNAVRTRFLLSPKKVLSEDEADALALLAYGMETYGGNSDP